LFFALSLSAQRHCGNAVKNAQWSADPVFSERQSAIRHSVRDSRMKDRSSAKSTPGTVITIPVVFHILYKNNMQNISDAQINSQLAAMNADFRRMNSDFSSVVPQAFQCFAADMEICFSKATVDPNGQATTGITRKQVEQNFDLENQYYTADGELAWDTSKYLNIWIGRFQTFGYLGFGTPPAAAGQSYDGLCISYKAVGCGGSAIAPFDKGRTIVHELGHYFGLSHPWGEDGSDCGEMANDDGIGDTPSINDPHFGLPSYPENSNMCDPDQNGAMFMNFMDYVNDEAMAFFTDDQKAVVQNTLENSRLSLLGVKNVSYNSQISIYPNPADKYVVLRSTSIGLEKAEIFTASGQLKKTVELGRQENIVSLDSFEPGVYFVRIYGKGGELLKSDKIIKK